MLWNDNLTGGDRIVAAAAGVHRPPDTQRGEHPRDDPQLYRHGAMRGMFDLADVARKGQRGHAEDDHGDEDVGDQRMRCRGHVERLHQEFGEQLQIIGDRYRIGDREGSLRHPHRPGEGIVGAKVHGEVLDMDDVEPDHPADRVGQHQQQHHRRERQAAEFLGEQRSADEEARSDDRRERRHGRAPAIRTRERAERQPRGDRHRHQKGDEDDHAAMPVGRFMTGTPFGERG